MSKCMSCGREFNGKFCPYCGTKAPETVSVGKNHIPVTNPSPAEPSSSQPQSPFQPPVMTAQNHPLPPTPPIPPQSAPGVPVKAKQPKGLLIVIMILLLLNLMVTVGFGIINLFGPYNSVERQAEQTRAFRDYLRETGENISVLDDSYVSSEYDSGSIQGTLQNDSSYLLENVSICIDFYNGDDYVDSSYDYIIKIPAGDQVSFDVYCPDAEFDSYAIAYIEAER